MRGHASHDRDATFDATRVWSAGDGLLLLRARYRQQRFPRHTHTTFVVGINEHSAHAFYCRHARHTVPPGTIALVNPEEVHTGESLGDVPWRYRGIYPEPAWIERLWREIVPHATGVPMFLHPAVEDSEVALKLLRFHRLSEHGADPLAEESAAVDAFTLLLCRHADRVPARSECRGGTLRVRRMREFIHAHFTTAVTLSALGHVAGLGRFGALRAFRRELGIAPYAYLTSLRLEHARALLLGGTPIADAAAAAGFSDQSHLTRRLKRHFGVTPGELVRVACARVNSVQDAGPAERQD